MIRPAGGWGFLLGALDEVAGQIFASVAHLLNLDPDIVLVDTSSTTSTSWEAEGPDLLADLAELAEPADDDGVSRPAEQVKRTFGHSRDFRDVPPRW